MIRTSIVSLIVILSLNINAASATNDSVITINANWEVGDSFIYKATKYQMLLELDEVFIDSAKYNFSLTVMEETGHSYLLKWQSYDFFLSELLEYGITIDETSDEMLSPLTILYETDQRGAFKDIVNMNHIRESFNDFFDSKVKQYNDEDQLSFFEIIIRYREALKDSDGLIQMVMPEIQIMHWPLGQSFSLYDTVFYTEMYPEYISSSYVNSFSLVYTDEFDEYSETVNIIKESKIDDDDAKRVIEEFFTVTGADLFDFDDPEEEEMFAFYIDQGYIEMKHFYTLSINYLYGVVDMLMHERSFVFLFDDEGIGVINVVKIELVEEY